MTEMLVTALEVTHQLLEESIRIVADTDDLEIGGERFISCPLGVTLPPHRQGEVPRGNISMPNIGTRVTHWLRLSDGGTGAKVRVMVLERANPEMPTLDLDMSVIGSSITPQQINWQLGYTSLLTRGALRQRWTPETAPALFTGLGL